jgi:hypothetical protein
MDYLVSPPAETEWRMDPAHFEAALRADWSVVHIHRGGADGMYAFDFAVVVGTESVDGGFALDGQVLGLLHDVYLCAEVAAWFRTLVPAEQPLLFYDQMFNADAELRPGMTGRELAAAYLAGWGA